MDVLDRRVKPENLSYYLNRKRGLQARLKDALGLTFSTISQWKSGERPVPQDHLPTICKVLECTEEDLCDRKFHKVGVDSPVVQAIHDFVIKLSPADQGRAYTSLVEQFDNEEKS